jgi:hypothetical protein
VALLPSLSEDPKHKFLNTQTLNTRRKAQTPKIQTTCTQLPSDFRLRIVSCPWLSILDFRQFPTRNVPQDREKTTFVDRSDLLTCDKLATLRDAQTEFFAQCAKVRDTMAKVAGTVGLGRSERGSRQVTRLGGKDSSTPQPPPFPADAPDAPRYAAVGAGDRVAAEDPSRCFCRRPLLLSSTGTRV